jgi:hypothetical protein
MEEPMTEVSDKMTERKGMSASLEAATLLRHIAGHGEPGETRKAAWLRAYRRLSGHWTFNRVKDLWRQEPRARVSADELNELRAAAQTTEAKDEVLARLESVEQMLRDLASRMPQDADFYGSHADTLRGVASRVGRADHSD